MLFKESIGNIITITDANGGTITYSYNSLGQVCEVKSQEGNSEYFYYDEEGKLTKQIDRNKNHVDKSYNIDGRSFTNAIEGRK